jgi:hypothetical protein
MDADLDLLLISVYCTADDLLPERPRNARRRLSDAEVVTLCVAQVLMGIPSDRRFLRAARHLFSCLPSQDVLHKRRARLAEAIEWLLGVFSSQCPGAGDDLLLLDSADACAPADRVGVLHLQGPAHPRMARRPHSTHLYARIATRLLALAACIRLNHELGRPSRALVDYTA